MAELQPHHLTAYVPLSQELADDDAAIREAMRRALAGEPLPPPRPTPTTPPAGHLRLLDATHGPLRAVVELHAPQGRYPVCSGCDMGAYADGEPDWPCSTVELIADHLGVDLREVEDG